MAAEPTERLVTRPFALVTLTAFCYFITLGATLPVVPRYVEGPLGGGPIAVGIGVGAFAFSAVIARPFVGRLGDRRGRRVLIVGGGGLLAVGTAGIALVDGYWWLILMRLVTGVGEAAEFVGAATLVSDLAPEERRGQAMSYFSVAIYGGLAVGPLLGETLLDSFSYDTVWLLAGSVALVGMLNGLQLPRNRPAEVAVVGRRRLLHSAGVGPGAVLGLGILGLTAWIAFMPLHADDLGLAGARYVFLLYGGLVLCVRVLGATIPDRFGPVPTASVALLSIGAGLVTMGVWGDAGGLYAGTAIFAIGMSLMYPALMSLAVAGVAEGERGAVMGTFTMFFDLSQGLGGALFGTVVALTSHEGAFIAAGLTAATGVLLLRGVVAPRRLVAAAPTAGR